MFNSVRRFPVIGIFVPIYYTFFLFLLQTNPISCFSKDPLAREKKKKQLYINFRNLGVERQWT